jgi:hypothetical protein
MSSDNKIDLNDYFPSAQSNSPAVKDNPTKVQTSDKIRTYLNQQLPIIRENATDPFMKHKPEMFGADLDNHQFERYALHPKFKELGFNPYIDNEARYNKNSTFSDDLSRASGQWWTLTKLGFADAMSIGPQSDREFAKNYDRAMKIGMSNRGGVGGFMNNLYLNSGYTVGIMGEIIAEEFLLAAGTLLTGGALGELAIVRSGTNIGRFLKGLFKAEEWAKKANKVANALDSLSDVNVARNVFQGLKTGTIGTGKWVGKQLTPESYAFLSNFDKLDNLSGIAKTGKGFGAFYRDTRNVRLAYGESALEAGMVENELLEENYKKFVEKFKREPNDNEIDEIRGAASMAAASTFWQNLPAIYFSNNITMGAMMRTFSPIRRLSALTENRFYKTMLTKEGIEVVEKGFKTAVKGLIQPKTYGKFALDYFSANLAEGLQESVQEIITSTNKDYYGALYGNATRGGYYETLLNNVGNQFSAQGGETFLSGFLMGGLIGSVSGTVSKGYQQVLKFTDPKYQEKKDAAFEETKKNAQILNDLYKDPASYNNPHLNDMVEGNEIAGAMAEAEKKGDQKAFQTLKNKAGQNKFWTVFETGLEDTFQERFTSLLNLSDEELMEEFPTAPSADKAREDLQSISSKMGEFKKTYDFVKTNLRNPHDPSRYKQGTPEYLVEDYKWRAWNESQKDVVFMRETFNNSLKRMASIMTESVKDVGVANMSASDLTVLFSLDETMKEIQTLRTEIDSFGDKKDLVTDAAIKLYNDKKSKLDNLLAYQKEMVELVKATEPNLAEINKEIGTGEGKIVWTKENVLKTDVYNKALKAYTNYVKGQAQGKPVFDKNLEAAFDKMIDYYLMDNESKNFTESINRLMNPKSFDEYAARKQEVIKVEHENRKQRIEEALEAYKLKKDRNDLLQALWAQGIFFDIGELEALETEGKMPTRIYDRTGKDQILSTSSKFNDAVDIFKQYVNNLFDIPLIYNKTLDSYDTTPREKFLDDERTYEDLAEQFGFDPKSSQSVLPAKEVLQKIVESDFATEQEQELAARLLTLSKDSDTITFVNDLAGPSIFTLDEQTVVDARYASNEFKQNAQSYPLEVAILREEVNRRLYGAVDKESENFDQDFNDTISKIRSTAIAAFEDQGVGAAPIGLTSNEDFIKEVMTNENFRAFLSNVEYPETKQSTWQKFLDSVIDMLKNVFGDISTNTALNAAISAITSKIDDRVNQARQAKTTATATGPTTVTPQDLSIDEIRQQAPGLINELVQAYKDYSQVFLETDPNNLPQDIIPNITELKDEEIEAHPLFAKFIKNNFNQRVIALFNKYFTKPSTNVRIIPRTTGTQEILPGIPMSIETTDELIITEEHKRALRGLDYTNEEIDEFNILEALNIIAFNESKADTAARLAEMAEQIDYGTNLRTKFISDLDAVQTYDDFMLLKENLDDLIDNENFFGVTGLKSEELDELLNNKRKELAFKLDFNDIKKGDVVVLFDTETNEQSVFIVESLKTKKGKKSLTLKSAKDPSKTFSYDKEYHEKADRTRYIFKYNPNLMQKEDLEGKTMSDESIQVSNQNIGGVENLTDEEIDNADKNGKKMNPSDALNNFLDNLNKVCQ